LPFREKRDGIQRAAVVLVITAPVKIVRAALDHHIYLRADKMSLLSVKWRRLDTDPDRDTGQAWDDCEVLLAIHPLLLAQAARRGLAELYPEQKFEDLLYLLEKLRNRILDLDLYASGSQIDKALSEARIRAAEAMGVDEVFVSRRLLPDAVALLYGALDKDHNLRVAIANSQAVRKYLAAAVIEKMIHGEIE
jgi:hypothetical protein